MIRQQKKSTQKKSSLVTPRVDLLEIERFAPLAPGGEWKDAEALLVAGMRLYAHAANRMVRHWILFHEARGTLEKLAAGEPTGAAVPGPLKKELYDVGRRAAPEIYSTSIQWLQQWLSSTIGTKQSSRNNCKMWTAVLRGSESPPCFTELPLRLYDTFAKFERDADGYLWLVTRLVRGAAGDYETLRMRLRRPRRNASKSQSEFQEIYRQAEKIADGEARLQCSQIIRRGRKWFLALTVERIVEAVDVEPKRILFLRPGRVGAWRGRYRGRSADVTDEPLDQVASLAWRITSIRERRERIIQAGRAPTRRGERNCRRSWHRTLETLNRQLASTIAAIVAKHKVGRVVLMDGGASSALLAAAGGHYPREQFRRFLAQNLTPTGVEVVERASLSSIKRRIARSGRKLAVERCARWQSEVRMQVHPRPDHRETGARGGSLRCGCRIYTVIRSYIMVREVAV